MDAKRDLARGIIALENIGSPTLIPHEVAEVLHQKCSIKVHIVALGPSSVELLVQAYFRVATYTDELSCRDEFSREILRQAERLGVAIAFPTHTVHLAGSGAAGHEVPPPPKLLGRQRGVAQDIGRVAQD